MALAFRAVALASLLTACWTGRATAPAPAAVRFAFAPTVRTCAVDPAPRAPERLVLRRWLGRIGVHSWLVAESAGRLVLVGLDGERIATTALPFDTLRADAITGDHLWLAGTVDEPGAARPDGGGRLRLVELDLAAAPARVVGAPVAWNAAPLGEIDALAVSDDRVLLAAHDAVEHQFQLFDRAQRRIGSMVTVRSSEPAPAHLRCAGARCLAIGVEGGDRAGRAFVVRFAADGGTESELLASDPIANLQVAKFGDRTIVVWTALDQLGLFARTLDAAGRPTGGRITLAGLPAAPLVFELITASPPRVAVRDVDDGWTLGTLEIDARRIDDPRALPLDGALDAFAGAVMPDGVLGAAFRSRAIDRVGGPAFAARATAVFVPAFGDPEPPIAVLPETAVDGRGGLAALPLIAPGHAAVLVVPRGHELADGGELVVVRRPCARVTAGSAPARTAR